MSALAAAGSRFETYLAGHGGEEGERGNDN